MNARRIAWSIVGVLSVSVAVRGADPVGKLAPSEAGGFVRGHIFVSVVEAEPCDSGGGRAWIVQINPESGAWSIFADSQDDDLCVPNGLRFTPEGSLLLVADAGNNWIKSFSADGTSEVLLDGSEGLRTPVGANCLAFDRFGDLYVLNAGNSTILRFPSGQPPATVFADYEDGIEGRGALEFAPSGDLFYTGDLAARVIRIDSIGQASFFFAPAFLSLAFDDGGNLFAGAVSEAFRFDGPGPDATTFRLLAEGLGDLAGGAIALSPDQQILYFAGAPGVVSAVDTDLGRVELAADFSALSGGGVFPLGATVYSPDPDRIPGRCCFALHTSTPGCIDGVTRLECGDESPPFLFTPKGRCPPKGPHCETITGACCNVDAFGGCSDDTLISECQCPTCTWHESQTCADIECAVKSIPTSSAWGLTAMSLSLMIGAKIVFGHGVEAGAKCATL